MTQLSLRSFHPIERKEVASLSARFLTNFTIAVAWFLTLAPFAVYFSR
jgi:hypothetical protein